ncbi:hypothetical protein B0H16DRAFT_1790077 [Mycena metata]|uniref:Uncharacterized protein n=1 Tax=Mycena metata TaxID=1033252 RepID=A0AAD7MLS9_9AGAR|nr:hypothetical protein B0H16DRAFT_1790077 [Mycena metata]
MPQFQTSDVRATPPNPEDIASDLSPVISQERNPAPDIAHSAQTNPNGEALDLVTQELAVMCHPLSSLDRGLVVRATHNATEDSDAEDIKDGRRKHVIWISRRTGLSNLNCPFIQDCGIRWEAAMRKVTGCKSPTPAATTPEDLPQTQPPESKFWPTLIILGYTLESKQEITQKFTPDVAAVLGFPRGYPGACERDWRYPLDFTRELWPKESSIDPDVFVESLSTIPKLLLMECLRLWVTLLYFWRGTVPQEQCIEYASGPAWKNSPVALYLLAHSIIQKARQPSIVEKLQKKEQILWVFELTQTTPMPNQSLHGLALRWETCAITLAKAARTGEIARLGRLRERSIANTGTNEATRLGSTSGGRG